MTRKWLSKALIEHFCGCSKAFRTPSHFHKPLQHSRLRPEQPDQRQCFVIHVSCGLLITTNSAFVTIASISAATTSMFSALS